MKSVNYNFILLLHLCGVKRPINLIPETTDSPGSWAFEEGQRCPSYKSRDDFQLQHCAKGLDPPLISLYFVIKVGSKFIDLFKQ